MITRAVRELDREKTTLEREEKRLTMEIKKAAKEQQMQSVKIMAKVRFISNRALVELLLLVGFSGVTDSNTNIRIAFYYKTVTRI